MAIGSKPKITRISADRTVGKGQRVVLNCAALGDPSPRFSWVQDGKFGFESNANSSTYFKVCYTAVMLSVKHDKIIDIKEALFAFNPIANLAKHFILLYCKCFPLSILNYVLATPKQFTCDRKHSGG